jgi:hypothetical protein
VRTYAPRQDFELRQLGMELVPKSAGKPQDKLTGQRQHRCIYRYMATAPRFISFDSLTGSPAQGLWVSTDGAGHYETIRYSVTQMSMVPLHADPR